VNDVLIECGFNIQNVTYAKDEGSNLSTMIVMLGLSTPFVGSHWGYAMFKCYQYAIDNTKVYSRSTSISIKKVIIHLVKDHNMDKKSVKG
jgi:hypothetical protein